MKNVTIAILFLLSIVSSNAQDNIKTIAIKGDQLITYAAENFPAEEPQLIYILVETGPMGINLESKFYLDKGVELLLKRLEDTDQIAIGVYGEVNATVMPYTEVSFIKIISEKIESLYKGSFSVQNKDGIDLAYEHANKHQDEETLASVIMLRGTGKNRDNTMATTQKSVFSQASTPDVSKEGKEDKTTKAQRKQVKATNHSKLGGAIALTALTILPDLIEIIKE